MFIIANLADDFESYGMIDKIYGYAESLESAKSKAINMLSSETVIIDLDDFQFYNRFDTFYYFDEEEMLWKYKELDVKQKLKELYNDLDKSPQLEFNNKFGSVDQLSKDSFKQAYDYLCELMFFSRK